MQTPLELPRAIAQFIGGNQLVTDEVGESPASVYAFTRGNERFFLKTCAAVYTPTTYSVLREARVLQWLNGRLNVPEVAVVAQSTAGEFMITRCVPGQPIQTRCDDENAMVALLREALQLLQAVPITNCPFDSSISVRLIELEYLISQDLCADDVDLEQWPNLGTPHRLLAHLHATRPTEEKAFSHGDLCDTNVFVDAHDQLHFIDLGRGGIADRWLDIAFTHRYLSEDFSDNAAISFLRGLGEPDQSEKRVFFEQLDELF